MFCLSLREREKERVCACTERGEAERGGQRIQSGLCTNSSEPDVGLKLRNHEIVTWAKVRGSTDLATQVP